MNNLECLVEMLTSVWEKNKELAEKNKQLAEDLECEKEWYRTSEKNVARALVDLAVQTAANKDVLNRLDKADELAEKVIVELEARETEIDDLRTELRKANWVIYGHKGPPPGSCLGEEGLEPEPCPTEDCGICSEITPGTVKCLECDAFSEHQEKCSDELCSKKCPPCPNCRPIAAAQRVLQAHLPQSKPQS